ncbi:hypothetical protein INS49_010781 [Diaporthe citri]|uniref:uncharacterized protein n=1 Tax=Diaporthe citri TaxID=83186 RepID=UPI001C7FF6E3|nr:uncharacterized protein INS49_010781 [Diaporthe citri]KAG6359729.1 hypothetical protein INS49_010781 [Diaporthe citri]
MSLGGEDVRKTEELPGAFPSEDAITKSELNNSTTTAAASGTTPAGTQDHTKQYPEHGLGAHQNVAQVGGANNSGIPSQSQNIAHTTAAGAGSTASPADSDPDHLLRRAGAEGKPSSQAIPSSTQQGTGGAVGRGSAQPSSLSSAANPLSGPAVGDDEAALGPENAPDITEDLKAVGSGAATAATAAAIAARDAAIAVKDAAAPVVGAASEQAMQAVGYAAENAGPAASAASEQAKNAAVYTRDSAVPAANAAASTVQANAPAALGGGTTATNTAGPRDVVPEVPGQVKSSLAEAGEAPEAAASRRAVQGKGQFEGELLGYAAELDADEARRQQQLQSAQQQQQQQKPLRPPPAGVLPRLDSGPQTPSTGVAVVMGTDTERSFPLGSHPVHAGDGGEQAAQSGPVATDGVQTSKVPQTSSGDNNRESAARRHSPPVEDKMPVRRGEEEAVGNGPDACKKLSSGTPSGVGQ